MRRGVEETGSDFMDVVEAGSVTVLCNNFAISSIALLVASPR